jgi:hypothetical protein
MRGVEIYVAPLVEQFKIPTLFPPDEFTLGLEYFTSLEGLKDSPDRISLGGAEVLEVLEAEL